MGQKNGSLWRRNEEWFWNGMNDSSLINESARTQTHTQGDADVCLLFYSHEHTEQLSGWL